MEKAWLGSLRASISGIKTVAVVDFMTLHDYFTHGAGSTGGAAQLEQFVVYSSRLFELRTMQIF